MAVPGAEKREAYLTVGVEVWVEPHRAPTSGLEIDLWGDAGVHGWEVDVKDKAATAVGCVLRPGDHDAPQH